MKSMLSKVLVLLLALSLLFETSALAYTANPEAVGTTVQYARYCEMAADGTVIVRNVETDGESERMGTLDTLPQLSAPGNLLWHYDDDGSPFTGYISWAAVTNCDGHYILTVYKNGELFDTMNWSGLTPDGESNRVGTYYSSQIQESGTYTFTVQAEGDGVNYSDSAVSGLSSAFVYARPAASLSTPSIAGWSGSEATWYSVAGAGGYWIEYYYQADSASEIYSWGSSWWVRNSVQDASGGVLNSNSWLGSSDSTGTYYYKVRALSPDINSVANSGLSAMSEGYYHTSSSSAGGGAIPVHSDDSSEVIESSKLEIDSLLEDVSFGTDKIYGPSITILGKTVYLFELSGKAKLDLGDSKWNIQAKADTEKKTIQLLVGFDDIDDKANVGGEDQSDAYWKESYQQVKSLYKNLAGGGAGTQGLYNSFRSLRGLLKDTNSTVIFNIKGTFAGYMEWSYETGNMAFSEGGMIITASAGGSIDSRIAAFPAAYVTVGLEVKAAGKISMAFDGLDNPLSISSNLTISPAINVGVGLGSKKLKTYVEGGLKGTLDLDILAVTGTFADASSDIDPLTVKVSGDIYLKSKVLLFSAEGKWNLFETQLYPVTSSSQMLTSGIDAFDSDSLEMLPRDYLDGGFMSPMSAGDTFSYANANLYPYCEPQLIAFSDGSMLLIWVDDNGTKADADRTSLYYSLYDPEDDSWSTAAAVWENDGYNGSPAVYVDGGSVYVVWQRVSEALGDTATVDAMMQKIDLYYSVFSGGVFSEPVCVSDASRSLGETMYSVAESDGTAAVTWVENADNDPLMASGTNTLYMREYSGGVWQDEEAIISTDSKIESSDVYIDGDNCYVSYELSGEGEDGGAVSSLYIWDGSQSTALIGDAANSTQAAVENGMLYYLDGGGLCCYDFCTGDITATGHTDLTNFDIVSNGSEQAVLTLVSTGFTSEMYASFYDPGEGTWGGWVQMTNYGRYIRSYSAAMTDEGKITTALNLVNVLELTEENEELYGAASLDVVDDLHYSDLAMSGYVTYDNAAVIPGGDLPLTFEVVNNSLDTLNSVTVTLTDEENAVLSTQEISCFIAAGDSAELETAYTLPWDLEKQNITVTATPNYDDDDADPTNNSAVVTVGYADVAFYDLMLESSAFGARITGFVVNYGYAPTEDIMVEVRSAGPSGKPLGTIDVGSIYTGGLAYIEYELPDEYLFLNTEYTMYGLYFEAVSDTEEARLDNNSDRVVFDSALPVQVYGTEENDLITVKAQFNNYTGVDMTSSVMLAVYDSEGKMLALQSDSPYMEAYGEYSTAFSVDRAAYPGDITVKLFWIDGGTYAPMTVLWSRDFVSA